MAENYTLTKILRVGLSPLIAMIGVSSYYGQMIGNPILGGLNALFFSKKLGIDVWNLNQKPSTKTKLLNSSKKILLGLGTISLANYNKFTNIILPIEPTTTTLPWVTLNPAITTTTIDPWPPLLMATSTDNNVLMDWDTYISLTAYGLANVISGVTELIPNKFETIRKIANMATGSTLIATGVAIGINNDFNNASAIPTIIAGSSEIIHNLLPMTTEHTSTELQETTFTNETARLINADSVDYGSRDSIDSLTSDVIYQSTTRPINSYI